MASPQEELLFRARPNLRIGAVDWPLFAVFGGIATGISFAVIVVQNPATRWVGLGWIAPRPPLLRRLPAPVRGRADDGDGEGRPAFGPALALEYRRLLVPVLAGRASDEAFDIAAGLAAERGAQITAVYVVEVPLDQPLSAELPAEEDVANRELDEARAIGESYGVTVIPRLVRAHCRRGDRPGSGAARHRDHRHRRPAEGRADPQARDLRPHGRPRAQERPLPRARDRGEGGGMASIAPPWPCWSYVRQARVALLAVTAAHGGGVLGLSPRRPLHRARGAAG